MFSQCGLPYLCFGSAWFDTALGFNPCCQARDVSITAAGKRLPLQDSMCAMGPQEPCYTCELQLCCELRFSTPSGNISHLAAACSATCLGIADWQQLTVQVCDPFFLVAKPARSGLH